MARRQTPKVQRRRCDCCGVERHDVEEVSTRIHPKVKGRKARIGMCCLTSAIIEREDHLCVANLEEATADA